MKVRPSILYAALVLFVASMGVWIVWLFNHRNYGRRAFGAKRSKFRREPRMLVRPQEVLNGSIEDSVNKNDRSLVGVASYCIYGDYKKYSPTLIKSVKRVPKLLPGWKARVYAAVDIPINLVRKLVRSGACVVIMGPFVPLDHEGQMWRFLPASETKPFLSLDADEVFGTTIDVSKVQAWLDSKKAFFINHKHTLLIPMDAGKWGSRGRAVKDMQKRLDRYADNWFGIDEAFLTKEIFPLVKKSGSYYNSYAPWPKWLLWLAFALVFAFVLSMFFLMWKEEKRRK